MWVGVLAAANAILHGACEQLHYYPSLSVYVVPLPAKFGVATKYKSNLVTMLHLKFAVTYKILSEMTTGMTSLLTMVNMTVFGMNQLYTLTTIVLVLQTIYYDHIVRWWESRQVENVDLFPEVSLGLPVICL